MQPFIPRPFSSGRFPELETLLALKRRAGSALLCDTVCEVQYRKQTLPVHCFELGSRDPAVPAVGFFGGIHGVERIGTQVLVSFMQTLVERLFWDDSLQQLLQQLRLVFIPLINPGGMLARTRSNPSGVDLMRNAPVDADHDVAPLLGGQRLSHRLPWYRGRAQSPMEPEAEAVSRVVQERLLPHAFSLSIDCHSGFGTRDRIWFPYARTREPIDCLADIYALRTAFRATHPYHSMYKFEPQAHQYTTHGDLWDYLYDESRRSHPDHLFLPLTLEMGSWLWVKKSPSQLFSTLGMFNPIAPHRHQRILRTHLTFFDFLMRAAISNARWRPSAERRLIVGETARTYWYGTHQPQHPA